MIKRTFAIASLSLCVLAGPLTANASLLFDNGAAIPGSGGADMWRYLAVDDFSLTEASAVSGGTFTFSTSNGRPDAPDDISYFVYANDLTGYDHPGALLTTGRLTISGVEPLSDPGYIPHFVATFSMETAFLAAADTLYWFGLLKGSNSDPIMTWVASDFTSPTRTWEQDYRYGPGIFRSVDYEKAYTLTGTAVPEPHSWALILLGFAGLGVSLRRHHSLGTPNAEAASTAAIAT